MKTRDIKSAFLQQKKLNKEAFLDPFRETGVHNGKIWRLNYCLFWLNDAAKQFFQGL